MSDIVERLRGYSLGDFDTHAAIRRDGATFAEAPVIADAEALMVDLYSAADEIERLQAIIDSVWPQMQADRDADRAEIERLRAERDALRAEVARLWAALPPCAPRPGTGPCLTLFKCLCDGCIRMTEPAGWADGSNVR